MAGGGGDGDRPIAMAMHGDGIFENCEMHTSTGGSEKFPETRNGDSRTFPMVTSVPIRPFVVARDCKNRIAVKHSPFQAFLANGTTSTIVKLTSTGAVPDTRARCAEICSWNF